MASILDVIATETHGSSFKTYKYGFDGIEVPRFDYDDHQYLRYLWPGSKNIVRHVPSKGHPGQVHERHR